MNFQTTEQLLAVVSQYMDSSNISLSSKSHSPCGRCFPSDRVTIDKIRYIGFEVFENEIIFFYLTAHHYFEEYSFGPAEEEPDYIAQAVQFLNRLFTLPILHSYTRCGSRTVREESCFLLPDGTAESLRSDVSLFWRLLFPKKTFQDIWRFDADQQRFRKEAVAAPTAF